VAHPIIALAFFLRAHNWTDALRKVYVTDTLGICFVVGSLVITRLGARARMLLGAALLVTSWSITATWTPIPGGWQWQVKDILVGDWRAEWLGYGFPPAPWLGFYLVATGFGTVAARLYDERGPAEVLRRAGSLGAASVLIAVACKLALRELARLGSMADMRGQLSHLGSLAQKIPPGPGYLLCFGGLALLMLTAVLALEQSEVGRAINRWAAVFGRTSLACFVVQFYVYCVGVFRLPRPAGILAPLYFLATVVLIRMFASAWDRMRANRIVTVGFPAAAHRWADRSQVRSPQRPMGTPG